MFNPLIRIATMHDLSAINDIYNHYVIHSTATYQTEPSTPQERLAWFEAHDKGYPVTVVEDAGEVIGWGSLSRFHVRAAYQPTVENSVYIRHDRLGIGIGRLILQDLISRANSRDTTASSREFPPIRSRASSFIHDMDSPRWRTCAKVGRKFDRWLDVIYMQRMMQ